MSITLKTDISNGITILLPKLDNGIPIQTEYTFGKSTVPVDKRVASTFSELLRNRPSFIEFNSTSGSYMQQDITFDLASMDSKQECMISSYRVIKTFASDINKAVYRIEMIAKPTLKGADEAILKEFIENQDGYMIMTKTEKDRVGKKIFYSTHDPDKFKTMVKSQMSTQFLSKSASSELNWFLKEIMPETEPEREIKEEASPLSKIPSESPIVTDSQKAPAVLAKENKATTSAETIKFEDFSLDINTDRALEIIQSFSKKHGIPEDKCALMRRSPSSGAWGIQLKNRFVVSKEEKNSLLTDMSFHFIMPSEKK